jgi:hypothetical protein
MGPARRRRYMHRRLRELDRLDRHPAHHDGRHRLVVALTTTVLIGAGVVAVQHHVAGSALGPLLSRHEPLGHPPVVAATGGSFAFVAHQIDGRDDPVATTPAGPST